MSTAREVFNGGFYSLSFADTSLLVFIVDRAVSFIRSVILLRRRPQPQP